eukprot:489475-Rhodomonas_salina.2
MAPGARRASAVLHARALELPLPREVAAVPEGARGPGGRVDGGGTEGRDRPVRSGVEETELLLRVVQAPELRRRVGVTEPVPAQEAAARGRAPGVGLVAPVRAPHVEQRQAVPVVLHRADLRWINTLRRTTGHRIALEPDVARAGEAAIRVRALRIRPTVVRRQGWRALVIVRTRDTIAGVTRNAFASEAPLRVRTVRIRVAVVRVATALVIIRTRDTIHAAVPRIASASEASLRVHTPGIAVAVVRVATALVIVVARHTIINAAIPR